MLSCSRTKLLHRRVATDEMNVGEDHKVYTTSNKMNLLSGTMLPVHKEERVLHV